MVIVVVGIPGSGKSSILSALADRDASVRIRNYGRAMLEVAGRDEVDRDRMRKLPPDQQAAIGVAAAQLIVEDAGSMEGSVTIVDTHALVQSAVGFVPGLPRPVLEVLKPRALCVVESAPEFVLKCREADQQRSRELLTLGQVMRHQELTRQFATACAAMSGCVLQFVENDGRAPETLVEPLVELIATLR